MNLKIDVITRNKVHKIFRKTNISYPRIREGVRNVRFSGYLLYQGVRNIRFGKFGALCFLVTPVLRFALLSYCLRYKETKLHWAQTVHWSSNFIAELFSKFWMHCIKVFNWGLMVLTLCMSLLSNSAYLK